MQSERLPDPTDRRQRYERALLQLSARLTAKGIAHRLVVDGQWGGDQISLVAEPDGGLVELTLERHDPTQGHAWLLADGPSAARSFADAIGFLAERTPRKATVQRGCLLTVTALARRVVDDMRRANDSYPTAALDKLRRAFPDARPMVGAHAPLRPAPVLKAASEHVDLEQLRTAHGAAVSTPNGPRAVRRRPDATGFWLPPGVRRTLAQRLGRIDAITLGSMAIAGPVAVGLLQDADDDERSFDSVNSADWGCDAIDCGLHLGDMGGCDAGGCDGFLGVGNCFGAIPDCGGLDCVPLDCGF